MEMVPMGRKHIKQGRPQVSKRTRLATPELDLMVRFTTSRNRDREGMGR